MVQVASFQPSPSLRPYVQVIRVIGADAGLSAPLPEPGLVMAVRYAGCAALVDGAATRRIPNATLSGIRASMRRIHTTIGGGLVVAVFRSTGAAHFFAGPLHELFGQVVDLGEIASRADVERLQSRLAEATSH